MSDFDYIIYTDGACSGNPGSGGWAAIIFNKNSGHKSKKIGGEIETTNNRMELIAIIQALESVPKESSLQIFTDSKYVINGIELWIKKLKINKWIGSNKILVKNKDLLINPYYFFLPSQIFLIVSYLANLYLKSNKLLLQIYNTHINLVPRILCR